MIIYFKKFILVLLLVSCIYGCKKLDPSLSEQSSTSISVTADKEKVIYQPAPGIDLRGGEITRDVRPRRGVDKQYIEAENAVLFIANPERSDGYIAFQTPPGDLNHLVGETVSFKLYGKSNDKNCKVRAQFHTLTNGGTEPVLMSFGRRYTEQVSGPILVPNGDNEVGQGELRIKIDPKDCSQIYLSSVNLSQVK